METKKDALTGVRLGAFSRMIACILTALLAAGMVPSGAVAYAAEGAGEASSSESADGDFSSADRVSGDVALDTSGSTSNEGGSEGAPVGDGTSDDIDADSASDAAAGTSNGAVAKYTGPVGGQTSADVVLNAEVTVGTIEYGGLAYTIDADDPTTVAVTGLASTAPKGDIVIPSQVASGNMLYTVTKIARGGGYLR